MESTMLFSMQIVAYLFLGGTAGGTLLLTCIGSLLFREEEALPRMALAFKGLDSSCILIGSVGLLAALLCLLWDLGRPERALNLFTTGGFNVLTVGALALMLDFAAALALGSVAFLDLRIGRAWRRGLEVACALFSLVTIVYTGVYLYSLDAVAFWHTPAIVALFLFSSLSAGASTVLLAAWLTPDGILLAQEVRIVKSLHLAFVALEAVALGLFLGAAAMNHNAVRSLAVLADEQTLATAVIGVGVMALAVPLVAEAYAAIAKSERIIPACDALCLVGGFVLRYCIVFCGTH